jgi:integrase
MRDGRPFQWILQGGRGDTTSTGRAMAIADWQRIRLEIIKAEQPDEDEFGMIAFKTPQDEYEHYAAQQDRSDYEESPLSPSMSYDEWKEFHEFKAWQKSKLQSQMGVATNGLNVAPILPAVRGAKPFKEVAAIFRAHLEFRFKQTKPGLKSREDISESRFHQYSIALAHLDAKLGETPIDPAGEFHIGEKQMTEILSRYRQLCKNEMTASEFTGHWFNERMKTVRSMVSYFAANRILSNQPPNIVALVEKYKIEANALPIPLPILRAIWTAADPKFQGFMLLALNCGFRQSEIQSLGRQHIKLIARKTCIEKLRGKTGVPLALPLWRSTERFIAKFANEEDKLFSWEDGKTAIAVLYHRMKKIRERVGRTMPKANDYSFENLRDTGASFFDGVNPMLTPLYLGHGDTRQAKHYVATIEDEKGTPILPMQLDVVLARFEKHLNLPSYKP